MKKVVLLRSSSCALFLIVLLLTIYTTNSSGLDGDNNRVLRTSCSPFLELLQTFDALQDGIDCLCASINNFLQGLPDQACNQLSEGFFSSEKTEIEDIQQEILIDIQTTYTTTAQFLSDLINVYDNLDNDLAGVCDQLSKNQTIFTSNILSNIAERTVENNDLKISLSKLQVKFSVLFDKILNNISSDISVQQKELLKCIATILKDGTSACSSLRTSICNGFLLLEAQVNKQVKTAGNIVSSALAASRSIIDQSCNSCSSLVCDTNEIYLSVETELIAAFVSFYKQIEQSMLVFYEFSNQITQSINDIKKDFGQEVGCYTDALNNIGAQYGTELTQLFAESECNIQNLCSDALIKLKEMQIKVYRQAVSLVNNISNSLVKTNAQQMTRISSAQGKACSCAGEALRNTRIQESTESARISNKLDLLCNAICANTSKQENGIACILNSIEGDLLAKLSDIETKQTNAQLEFAQGISQFYVGINSQIYQKFAQLNFLLCSRQQATLREISAVTENISQTIGQEFTDLLCYFASYQNQVCTKLIQAIQHILVEQAADISQFIKAFTIQNHCFNCAIASSESQVLADLESTFSGCALDVQNQVNSLVSKIVTIEQNAATAYAAISGPDFNSVIALIQSVPTTCPGDVTCGIAMVQSMPSPGCYQTNFLGVATQMEVSIENAQNAICTILSDISTQVIQNIEQAVEGVVIVLASII